MNLRAGCATPASDGFRIRRMPLAGGVVVVAVAGELDLCSSQTLREHLTAAVDSGASSIVVDLGELSFIDSTGLGVLALLARRLTLEATELMIVSPEGRARGLLAMTGLDRFIPVYPTRGEALRGEALRRGPQARLRSGRPA